MRKIPFSSTAKPLPEPIAATPADDEQITDIGDLLTRRPKAAPEPQPEPQDIYHTHTNAAEEEKTRQTGIEEPEFEPTTAEKQPEPSEPMFDPEGFAKTIVDIVNIARNSFYPGIYDKIVFNEFERRDLFEVHRKINIAKKQNGEPDLTEYEKELKAKHDELTKAKLKIDFKESERNLLAKKLARHLEKINWMKKLEQYDWILILIALEGFRFAELRKIKKMGENA
jgi:hypothetical protein